MTPKDNIEECSKIFVSWAWMAGIIIGFIVLLTGISWTTSSAYSNIISVQASQTQKLNELTLVYKDVDTIKALLRAQYKKPNH